MIPVPVRWLIAAGGAALLVLAAWWLVTPLTSGKRAEVEARLEAGRGAAMAESATDAVNTIGTNAADETAIDKDIDDGHAKIDRAPDVGGADAAARDSLCQLSPDYC